MCAKDIRIEQPLMHAHACFAEICADVLDVDASTDERRPDIDEPARQPGWWGNVTQKALPEFGIVVHAAGQT